MLSNQLVPFRSLVALTFYLTLVFCLGGCSFGLLSPPPSRELYIFDPPVPGPASNTEVVQQSESQKVSNRVVVLLRDTRASKLVSSDRILFIRERGRLGFYQLARWSEPLARRFSSLIEATLASSPKTEGVGRATLSVRGDYLLESDLEEAVYDAVTLPGKARVALRATLVDLRTNSFVGTSTFLAETPVQKSNAAGAVEALEQSTTKVLADLRSWYEEMVTQSF